MNANAKRTRPELDRHPNYYFEDGNIILAFDHDNIMFRLYRGLLAHHSQVFYDMLSLPQVQQPLNPIPAMSQLSLSGLGSPQPSRSGSRSGTATPRVDPTSHQEVIEAGVPVIRLTDRARDFTCLLDVIMGITPEQPSMDTIEGALRISGKYMFDGVRMWATAHIKKRLPTTLEDLMADPSLSVYGDRTLAARVVALAREFELGELVPLALYAIVAYNFSDPPIPSSPLFTPLNSPLSATLMIPTTPEQQQPQQAVWQPNVNPIQNPHFLHQQQHPPSEGGGGAIDPLGPSLTALSVIHHTLPDADSIRVRIGAQRIHDAAISYLFQLREYGLMKISCSRKVGQYQRTCAAGNVHAVWSRPQPPMAEFIRNPLGVMAVEGKAYDYSTMCGDCNAAGQAKHIELVANLFGRLPEIFMLSDVMVAP
ncbi:hypothetical protein FRB96_006407 [Tulasnella sp. 330]|nr:hypothetical protein FRB96_006407 [Tulasnella sp. 330]KAG8871830.1 hypothetical protein FRB97_008276 [Tulasnella sp. 331]KAG8886287.1 hypothetical protein FRB98_001349 [Tulasnella sp. 332]